MDETITASRMVNKDPVKLNSETLNRELGWFAEVLDTRLKLYFGQECKYSDITEINPPEPLHADSMYAGLISHYNLSFEERIVITLALTPYLRPHLLDVFFAKNADTDRGFTEFGGVKGLAHGGFLPTGETALFILAGENLQQRINLQYLFDPDHFFSQHGIIKMETPPPGEPFLSGVLGISREIVDFVTIGQSRRPNFDRDFPAKRINTTHEWSDLVLEPQLVDQIDEIKSWIDFEHTIMNDWGMSRKLKPGYRALFHGPPGTGKTLTACLIGKLTSRDVYRIDLSMVVSKYIGETEKNLSKIFEQAEHKNWILFFDEADALFGKRTKVEDAHDRYANQEVSYLLQRLEDFPGIVILASNFKTNLDDAFTRRFQTVVSFPMPRPVERLKLWQQAFSDSCVLEERIKLHDISTKYEISGGSMMNVVRYVMLMALRRKSNVILLEDLEEGVRREFKKEGRSI
ncbi:MAG: ATPase AAA [Bacteroidetes bacterium]|nr:MAG: ATPase AAA [Bacteroidota bacterium]